MNEKNLGPDTEFSILDLHENRELKKKTPVYFQDLNLDTILDRMMKKWGRSIREYYLYLPETAEDTAYRREVYGDVKKEAVYGALTAFTEQMSAVEELRRKKEKVPGLRQRSIWQLREVEAFCRACEDLAEALEGEALSSDGMRRFRGVLRDILDGGEYRQMREQVYGIMERIRSLRLTITYEKDRIRVEIGETAEEYGPLRNRETKPLRNPFAANPVITELESECLDIMKKKKPELFRELLGAAERYEAYLPPVVVRFDQEIRFYLSYASLQREMEGNGYFFAVPAVPEHSRLEGKGLYDLALAIVSLKTGKKVIPNDCYLGEEERFFVLSGPNQGGKTTFARSLGQLVYFARIGLDVPAREAGVPFYPDIQTHFSVEESMETGRGKLKEELTRLAPMMEDRKHGSFVIINELFTTAASHDALIMGRKVLEHFIRLGCVGIYVTHLKELSTAHEKVVSLRAMLDENRVQTFEIRRGEAPDVPCAENQVNKYRLTYEQLKERL